MLYYSLLLITATTGAFEGHTVPPVFKADDSVIAVVNSSAEVSVTVGIQDNKHLKTTPAAETTATQGLRNVMLQSIQSQMWIINNIIIIINYLLLIT